MFGTRRALLSKATPAPVAGLTTLVYDDFPDANGIAIDTRLPSIDTFGNSWVRQTGTWTCNGAGQVGCTAIGNQQYASILTQGNGTITTRCRYNTALMAQPLGVLLRYQDINNLTKACIVATTNIAAIYERVTGVDNLRASVAFTPVVNTFYTLKVIFTGTQIDLYVDDVWQCGYATTVRNTNYNHGMITVQQRGQFDNWKLEA